MNNHANHICLSRDEGVRALLGRCTFLPRTERVALKDAFGRVCAQDIRALRSLPNTLTSTMDAIAVRFDAFANGMPRTDSWRRGADYEFCNTGIGMPEGFDTAIRIEDVRVLEDGGVELASAPRERGENTVKPGSSMRKDELLVEAGRELSPALVALTAQGGYSELPVFAKPRVAFIPSGNELRPAGSKLARGKSIECNSLMFAGKVAAWGGEPVINAICPDVWQVVRDAIAAQVQQADIIVVNAGSSKGTDDLTVEVLEELGEVVCHEFAHGPGRHSSLSIVNGTPVIGIAGPPIGAEFCFEFYVKPFVDAYYGRAYEPPRYVWAELAEDLPMQPRAVDVVLRAALGRGREGQLVAHVLPNSMKPVLKMCDAADGLLTVDRDSWGWSAGDAVPVELPYPYTLPA